MTPTPPSPRAVPRTGRRDFLRQAAAWLASGASLAASGACAAPSPARDAEVTRPELLSSMGPERVAALGRVFMQHTPRESTASALREAIHGRLHKWPGSPPRMVSDLVAHDFASGRTVLLDGWLLSVTEARQCALYALTLG